MTQSRYPRCPVCGNRRSRCQCGIMCPRCRKERCECGDTLRPAYRSPHDEDPRRHQMDEDVLTDLRLMFGTEAETAKSKSAYWRGYRAAMSGLESERTPDPAYQRIFHDYWRGVSDARSALHRKE